MSTPLNFLSAKQIVEKIKRKEVSCVEVMRAYLEQIKKVNPSLNAIVEKYSDEVLLHQAKQADESTSFGKLHGLPVTIKQGRKVKGLLCNLGNLSPLNHIAQEDCTVAARLGDAGALVLGVTNAPDFEMTYETESTLYGRTFNPYDLSRSPGGSSGGEAAIIAAGGSALGIGADAGGSIRQPAHYCGIVGLKPTLGLIPNTGIFPANQRGANLFPINVQGPFARYVDDIALVLPILAGVDGQDPSTVPMPLKDPTDVDLKALRIAFYTDNGIISPRQDVAEVIINAAKALSRAVALVSETRPPLEKESFGKLEEILYYGGDRGAWLKQRMTNMEVTKTTSPFQEVLARAERCEFSMTEAHNRLIFLDRYKISIMEFMRDFDAILCPVSAGIARSYDKTPLEEGIGQDLTYNVPYSIMGWPSIVVRCGTSTEGMPIGVQIVSKAWREDIVLAIAKHLETILGGLQQPA